MSAFLLKCDLSLIKYRFRSYCRKSWESFMIPKEIGQATFGAGLAIKHLGVQVLTQHSR
jgi:hypothetical protein